MQNNSKLQDAAKSLWSEQSEKNWKAFGAALKNSNVRYYRIIFANEGHLNKMQDLTKSFAELYDARYKLVTKVPIFKSEKNRIRGATIYLSGLQVANGVD